MYLQRNQLYLKHINFVYFYSFKHKYQTMRSFSMQIQNQVQQYRPLMLNQNIQYTNLIRSNKSRKKKKKIYPIVLVVLFAKKIRRAIKKRKTRQKLMEQWHLTETSYYIDLWIMINYIKKPMQQMKIINFEQAAILFPEIEGMIKLSQMMLSVLETAIKSKRPYEVRICKQINNFVNGYKIYGNYFNYHNKNSKMLADLSYNFQNQMKEIESRMQAQYSIRQPKKQTITIKDCMEQPFYRLFKYVLLLKQYLKKMPKYHPDYAESQKCYNSFHEVNNYYNNLMHRVQQQQKKTKLLGLLKQSTFIYRTDNIQLSLQTHASTVFSDVKVYVFNTYVLVTNFYTVLGIQKQQRYGLYQLGQFSYIALQQDLKYYKNIVILVSKDKCVHLFFNDQSSRLQFYRCIQKIIKQMKIKQQEMRGSQSFGSTALIRHDSLSFSDHQLPNIARPQFIVEVVGCQIRPTGTLTNDSIYYLRIMIPFYHDDEINFYKKQQASSSNSLNLFKKQSRNSRESGNSSNSSKASLPQRNNQIFFSLQLSQVLDDQQYIRNLKNFGYKCINQIIQIHFNTIQEIYKQMKTKNIDSPDIDPPMNETAYSAKIKRKTKSYESRRIFIQQFFNYALRSYPIMVNPSWLTAKLRVNQDLWNYCIQKNSQMLRNSFGGLKINYNEYHCNICSRAQINTIQEFQSYRNFYNQKKDHRTNIQKAKYCFNFFSILRLNYLALHQRDFNTIQRILTYYHYLQGRIDYPFFSHSSTDKLLKLIKIYLPSVDQRYQQIYIDSKSTVGQVLDQMAKIYKMTCSFDFDLMVTYEQKYRILDRDEYLFDVVKSLDVDFSECQHPDSLRKSKGKQGFITKIKSLGNKIFQSQQMQNKIYFLKTTYLHKSLQIKSFAYHPKKKEIEVEKLFWIIKKGMLKLTQKQLFEFGSIFYCLRQISRIQSFTYYNLSSKLLEKIVSDQYSHLITYDQHFRKQFANAINAERALILKNNKSLQYIYHQTLELAFQKLNYKTYFIQVEGKQIPPELALNNSLSSYILGVNNKSLIIKRVQTSSVVTTLPIQQIQFQTTVFSIFITYQKWNFRFDGKMLSHFGQKVRRYQKILMKFPQHMIQ